MKITTEVRTSTLRAKHLTNAENRTVILVYFRFCVSDFQILLEQLLRNSDRNLFCY